MSLHELAEKVGVSTSALSQIERSKSFPSIVTLKSIAVNLDTTIGELVGEHESLGKNPVMLKNDIRFIQKNVSGTSLYVLSHHDTGKLMDTFLLRFTGSSGTEELFPGINGQIFCHVILGEVEFTLDGKSFLLAQGDNIYFHAKTSYRLVNAGGGNSEVLWIQTPVAL